MLYLLFFGCFIVNIIKRSPGLVVNSFQFRLWKVVGGDWPFIIGSKVIVSARESIQLTVNVIAKL